MLVVGSMLTAMARPVASVATSAVLLPSGTTLKMELGLLCPSVTIKYREPLEAPAAIENGVEVALTEGVEDANSV